uniref:Uncharacterized protein n=1 Tax=viral metagenome TaxID=1070528 RepID=A0A6H2A665_9ZZZZ
MSIEIDMEIMLNGDDHQTNFGTMLLKLIFKADRSNIEKLRLGFPEAVKAVEYYKETGEIIAPTEVS